MGPILALAMKDLRLLLRARSGIFFTFVWPLLVAVFFGVIFAGNDSGTAKIPVVVADEDASAASHDFVTRLQESSNLNIDVSDREHANALVRQGKRTAAIILPRGFGAASERVFYGDPPKIEVWIDPSRKAETAMLQGLLFQQAATNMQRFFSDRAASQNMIQKALGEVQVLPDTEKDKPVLNRFLKELDQFVGTRAPSAVSGGKAGWEPLTIETREAREEYAGPRNSYSITFPQGILWGIIGCVMTFGIGIVTERTHGTMIRLQMSPLSRFHLLAGKAIACFTSILVIEAALFAFGRLFFRVRPDSWALLCLAGLTSAIAFVGIMMMTSTLGKNEQAAAGAGWAIMMPLSMLGGGMVPLFFMPRWMATLSNVSPVKWSILAIEGALWRGFSLREMFLPCVILVSVGIVTFAIGMHTFRAES
jgi:ABC-2 type transport system permease protein